MYHNIKTVKHTIIIYFFGYQWRTPSTFLRCLAVSLFMKRIVSFRNLSLKKRVSLKNIKNIKGVIFLILQENFYNLFFCGFRIRLFKVSSCLITKSKEMIKAFGGHFKDKRVPYIKLHFPVA